MYSSADGTCGVNAAWWGARYAKWVVVMFCRPRWASQWEWSTTLTLS